MQQAVNHINEILGIQAGGVPVPKGKLDKLPMFIPEIYRLYRIELFNTNLLLAELKNGNEISILQTEKHLKLIKEAFNCKAAIVLENVAAYNRKRLIEKDINFIVPGKQLYLPDLLIDLRENYPRPKTKQNEKLLPSAQLLLIYHLIHRHEKWKLEDHPFKEIARKLHYSPMAVTNAIEQLKHHEFVEVTGEKEKFIRFRYEGNTLWNRATEQNLLVNPVIKTVFMDEKPKNLFLLHANTSALAEYADLNPGKQKFYAIEKTVFNGLEKNNTLVNRNEYEGRYAIEVWKYNPLILVNNLSKARSVTDPLSLYLSLKDNPDERVQMALEQIIKKFIW